MNRYFSLHKICVKIISIGVVCLFLVNDLSFAADGLKINKNAHTLSPVSRIEPIVTVEEKDGKTVIVENAGERARLVKAFQEDAGFIYLNTLITQVLHKFGSRMSAEGLKDLIGKHLSHVDFTRFKWKEMYKEGDVFCLPYERKDDGRIQILRYYPSEGKPAEFPHQIDLKFDDGSAAILEDPMREEREELPVHLAGSLITAEYVATQGILSAKELAERGITVSASADDKDLSREPRISCNMITAEGPEKNKKYIDKALYEIYLGSLQVVMERQKDEEEGIIELPGEKLKRLLEERARHSFIVIIDPSKLQPENMEQVSYMSKFFSGCAEMRFSSAVTPEAFKAVIVPAGLAAVIGEVFPPHVQVIETPRTINKEITVCRNTPLYPEHPDRGTVAKKRTINIEIPDYEAVLNEWVKGMPEGGKLLTHVVRLTAPSDAETGTQEEKKPAAQEELKFCPYSELPERLKTEALYELIDKMNAAFRNPEALLFTRSYMNMEIARNLRLKKAILDKLWGRLRGGKIPDLMIAFNGEDKPVGIYSFVMSAPDESKTSWANGIFVGDEFRARGIGKILREALMDYLKERGYEEFRIGDIDNDFPGVSPDDAAQNLTRALIKEHPDAVKDASETPSGMIWMLTVDLTKFNASYKYAKGYETPDTPRSGGSTRLLSIAGPMVMAGHHYGMYDAGNFIDELAIVFLGTLVLTVPILIYHIGRIVLGMILLLDPLKRAFVTVLSGGVAGAIGAKLCFGTFLPSTTAYVTGSLLCSAGGCLIAIGIYEIGRILIGRFIKDKPTAGKEDDISAGQKGAFSLFIMGDSGLSGFFESLNLTDTELFILGASLVAPLAVAYAVFNSRSRAKRLVRKFEGKDPLIRINALERISGFGKVAIPPLAEALKSDDITVQTLAVTALGNIAGKRPGLHRKIRETLGDRLRYLRSRSRSEQLNRAIDRVLNIAGRVSPDTPNLGSSNSYDLASHELLRGHLKNATQFQAWGEPVAGLDQSDYYKQRLIDARIDLPEDMNLVLIRTDNGPQGSIQQRFLYFEPTTGKWIFSHSGTRQGTGKFVYMTEEAFYLLTHNTRVFADRKEFLEKLLLDEYEHATAKLEGRWKEDSHRKADRKLRRYLEKKFHLLKLRMAEPMADTVLEYWSMAKALIALAIELDLEGNIPDDLLAEMRQLAAGARDMRTIAEIMLGNIRSRDFSREKVLEDIVPFAKYNLEEARRLMGGMNGLKKELAASGKKDDFKKFFGWFDDSINSMELFSKICDHNLSDLTEVDIAGLAGDTVGFLKSLKNFRDIELDFETNRPGAMVMGDAYAFRWDLIAEIMDTRSAMPEGKGKILVHCNARDAWGIEFVADNAEERDSWIDKVRDKCKGLEEAFYQELRKEYEKDRGACFGASYVLARVLSACLDLPVDGDSPDRIEVEVGEKPDGGVIPGVPATHAWVVICRNGLRTLQVDPTRGQYDPRCHDRIYVGEYEDALKELNMKGPDELRATGEDRIISDILKDEAELAKLDEMIERISGTAGPAKEKREEVNELEGIGEMTEGALDDKIQEETIVPVIVETLGISYDKLEWREKGDFRTAEISVSDLDEREIRIAFDIPLHVELKGVLTVVAYGGAPVLLYLDGGEGRMKMIDLSVYLPDIDADIAQQAARETVDKFGVVNVAGAINHHLYVVFNDWGGIIEMKDTLPDPKDYRVPIKTMKVPILPGVFAVAHSSSLISARATAKLAKPGMKVLVIGSGPGIEARIAAELGAEVHAVDIQKFAVENTKITCSLGKAEGKVNAFINDLFEGLGAYDLIIFNMPHVGEKMPKDAPPRPSDVNTLDPGAKLLERVAEGIADHIAPGGQAVLVNTEFYPILDMLEEKTGLKVRTDFFDAPGTSLSQAYIISKKAELEKPMPDGSAYSLWRMLLEEPGRLWVTAEDLRFRTRGRMDDGRLSLETVKRDLGTLVYLGIVEENGRGEDAVYRASDLSPPQREAIEIVLKSLGARPRREDKIRAKQDIEKILQAGNERIEQDKPKSLAAQVEGDIRGPDRFYKKGAYHIDAAGEKLRIDLMEIGDAYRSIEVYNEKEEKIAFLYAQQGGDDGTEVEGMLGIRGIQIDPAYRRKGLSVRMMEVFLSEYGSIDILHGSVMNPVLIHIAQKHFAFHPLAPSEDNAVYISSAKKEPGKTRIWIPDRSVRFSYSVGPRETMRGDFEILQEGPEDLGNFEKIYFNTAYKRASSAESGNSVDAKVRRVRELFGKTVIVDEFDLDPDFQRVVEEERRRKFQEGNEGGSEVLDWVPHDFEISSLLKCTLRCQHCMYSSGPEREEEASISEMRRMLDTAGIMVNIPFTHISGGEILLRKDLLEIIGEFPVYSLTTNATTMTTPEKAQEFILSLKKVFKEREAVRKPVISKKALAGDEGYDDHQKKWLEYAFSNMEDIKKQRDREFEIDIGLDDLHMAQTPVNTERIANLVVAAVENYPEAVIGFIALDGMWGDTVVKLKKDLAKRGYNLRYDRSKGIFVLARLSDGFRKRIPFKINFVHRLGRALYLPDGEKDSVFFAEFDIQEDRQGLAFQSAYSVLRTASLDHNGDFSPYDAWFADHSPLVFGNAVEERWDEILRRLDKDPLFRAVVGRPDGILNLGRILDIAEEFEPGVIEQLQEGRPGTVAAVFYWLLSNPERKLYATYRLLDESYRAGILRGKNPFEDMSRTQISEMVKSRVAELRDEFRRGRKTGKGRRLSVRELEDVDAVIADFDGVDRDHSEGIVTDDTIEAKRELSRSDVHNITITGLAAGMFLERIGGVERAGRISSGTPYHVLTCTGAVGNTVQKNGFLSPINGFEGATLGDKDTKAKMEDIAREAMRAAAMEAGIETAAAEAIKSMIKDEQVTLFTRKDERINSIRHRIAELIRSKLKEEGFSKDVEVACSAGAVDITATSKKKAAIQIIKLLGLRKVILVGDSAGTEKRPGNDRGLLTLTREDIMKAGIDWDVEVIPVYVGRETEYELPGNVVIAEQGEKETSPALDLYGALIEAKNNVLMRELEKDQTEKVWGGIDRDRLTSWLEEWKRVYGVGGEINIPPLFRAGNDRTLSVFIGDRKCVTTFDVIKDLKTGKVRLILYGLEVDEGTRRKKLMSLVALYLIHLYGCDEVYHYRMSKNHGLGFFEGLKKLGVYRDVFGFEEKESTAVHMHGLGMVNGEFVDGATKDISRIRSFLEKADDSRGWEGLPNEEYTPEIRDAIDSGNIFVVEYDGQKAVPVDTFLREARGEILLGNIEHRGPGLRYINKAIGKLCYQDKRLLEHVSIVFFEGERGAHYSLSRAKIYINLKYQDNTRGLERLLHHELAERAYVIEKMDAFDPSWRQKRGQEEIENKIRTLAAEKHEVLKKNEESTVLKVAAEHLDAEKHPVLEVASFTELMQTTFRGKQEIRGFDLGTATGEKAQEVKELLSKHVRHVDFVGIEKDERRAEIALKYGYPVVQADAIDLSSSGFEKGSMDLVTSFSPHPLSIKGFVETAKYLVNEDGIIIISLAGNDMVDLMQGKRVYHKIDAEEVWDILADFQLVKFTGTDDWPQAVSPNNPYAFIYTPGERRPEDPPQKEMKPATLPFNGTSTSEYAEWLEENVLYDPRKYNIRKAGLTDIEAVEGLSRRINPAGNGVEAVTRIEESGNTGSPGQVYVYEENGEVRGYIWFEQEKNSTSMKIEEIAVKNEDEGKGIASLLLGMIMEGGLGLGVDRFETDIKITAERSFDLFKKFSFSPGQDRSKRANALRYHLDLERATCRWRFEIPKDSEDPYDAVSLEIGSVMDGMKDRLRGADLRGIKDIIYELALNILDHAESGYVDVYTLKGPNVKTPTLRVVSRSKGKGLPCPPDELIETSLYRRDTVSRGFGFPRIVKDPDRVVIEYDGDKWTRKDTAKFTVERGKGSVTAGVRITLDFDVSFENDLHERVSAAQEFADAVMARAFEAAKQGENIIIGLDISWIADMQGVQGLINRISRLTKDKGLDNIIVIRGRGIDLAGNVIREAEKTGTPLSNVIVLGEESVIRAKAFDALRSTDTEKKAFLAGVNARSLGEDSYISLLEMLTLAIKLAFEDIDSVDDPNMVAVKTGPRTWIFIPRARPMSFEEKKTVYEAQTQALTAA